jgi:hypothetical protein
MQADRAETFANGNRGQQCHVGQRSRAVQPGMGTQRVFGTCIVSGTFMRPHDTARQSVIANKEHQRCRSGTHHDSTPLHS